LEVRPAKKGTIDVGIFEIRCPKIRTTKKRMLKVCSFQDCRTEVRPIKVNPFEVRLMKVCSSQVRPRQVGILKESFVLSFASTDYIDDRLNVGARVHCADRGFAKGKQYRCSKAGFSVTICCDFVN
jgi:hypothetical protein